MDSEDMDGEGMNWSRLVRDRAKRRDFVNTG